MKTIIFLLLLSPITLFPVSTQIPDVSLYNLDNEYVNLSELKGEKLTIIDFWATWCKPCLIAIPELNKLYEKYNGQGVNFIGINIDSPRNQSKVRPFARSRGLQYDLLMDPDQQAMRELNVVVVPTMLIFNAEGDLVFTHEGFKPGDQELILQEMEKNLK